MKKSVFTLAILLVFMAGSAFATSYTIYDYVQNDPNAHPEGWINWNNENYGNYGAQDEINNPSIDNMVVDVVGGFLQKVTINYNTTTREIFDSLFINTSGAWDSWDYFVMSKSGWHNDSNYDNVDWQSGTLAADGLYSVDSGYTYNITNSGRKLTPVGISDQDDVLSEIFTSSGNSFAPTIPNYNSIQGPDYLPSMQLVYDFSNLSNESRINVSGGLFLAYAPWCGNDVIGGSAPVPEPATIFLLCTGIAGLALRRKFKK